ncbi:Protein CBG24551, partial [Caenorhabditis briggsae]
MIEGAAPLPTEPRGRRESARPIAYIKARTTAVRRVALSVVHRHGKRETVRISQFSNISWRAEALGSGAVGSGGRGSGALGSGALGSGAVGSGA